jgi:hypothetical protein
MNGFTVPVSMLASKGSGGALAAGVVGLLLVLALMNRRDPTAAQPPSNQTAWP